MIRFSEKLQVVPLRSPAVSTDTFKSANVKVKNMHWISFLLQWGALDNGATNTLTIRPYSTTNVAGTTNSADTGLPFQYRLLSEAVGGDTWGSITAISSTGGYALPLSRANTNRMMIVDVDPSVIPGLDSNATHVYLKCTNNGNAATDAVYAADIIGVFEVRYPKNDNLSST